MGRKCTVFGCWGGYKDHKCTVFGFPQDPVEKRKWFVVIPNDNLTFEQITVIDFGLFNVHGFHFGLFVMIYENMC